MMVAISALTVGAVFVLRARAPGLARPYRAWGYPAVPAMYLAACLGMGVSAFAHHPVASCAALGIVAAGIPVYRWRAGRAGTWRPMPGHG
jgi:APA family basic amino acid/polyamine antiporter